MATATETTDGRIFVTATATTTNYRVATLTDGRVWAKHRGLGLVTVLDADGTYSDGVQPSAEIMAEIMAAAHNL